MAILLFFSLFFFRKTFFIFDIFQEVFFLQSSFLISKYLADESSEMLALSKILQKNIRRPKNAASEFYKNLHNS